MLNRISKWNLIQFPRKFRSLCPFATLIFTELSVSAAKLEDDPITTSIVPGPADTVREILVGLKNFELRSFLSGTYFRAIASTLNQPQVDQIIDRLGIENPDSALAFFDFLRNEYGFQHSRVSQFVVAHVLASKRRFKDLHLVVKKMLEEEGSGSAPSLCDLLLNNFRGWDSNNVVWDMLAFAYSRSNMVHDALFVIACMKDQSLQASIQTYNSLLHNLRHTDIMWDVYDEIKVSGPPENEYTSSILIDGLCEQSRFQEAILFFQPTEGNVLGPSVASFNTFMSRFCNLGFVDLAKSFFCMMLKYGLLPDVYSYNILIHGLFLAGSMEEALNYRDDMEKQGLKPDIITYNILVKGHCKTGNIEEGLKLVEEMLSCGFELNIISYSVLLSSLCKSGRIDEALKLFYDMDAVGMKPDLITYSILIHGLCKLGERMLGILEEMEEKSVRPTHITYTVVIKGLCQQLKLQESVHILNDMYNKGLHPDQITYNTIIHCFCRARNLTKAFQLFNEMLMNNLEPTPATYNVLIDGICVYGNLEDADGLMVSLEQQNVHLTKVAYTTIIKAHCAKGDVHRAVVLLHKMVEKGFQISFRDYSAVINRLCKRCFISEAKYFFCMMLSDGISPDKEICEVMINAFRKSGNLGSVSELVAEMIKTGLLSD
ncbi:Pentatricopeptide repeat-containing protein [Quillaja saponaria]|uniref:Pentatricopeptide repeat-containing protein n=1 Tax=Quillaja saponaria TaxID=32244 RepID=A0AAD7L9G3_QUISA|nr:Pentatricopeptide repeat-containing protein [Quillaja saponaria]